MKISDAKIGIIGLGYVGLPLAVEFDIKSVLPIESVDGRL